MLEAGTRDRSGLRAYTTRPSRRPTTSAATLNVSGGILLGASDVDVDGTPYDVVFVEGTCIDVFSGCDSNDDFNFNNPDALLATLALLDQVFLDGVLGSFDSEPELTFGCTTTVTDDCHALTPYAVVGESVFTWAPRNLPELPTRSQRS